jgi:hypothetical protein
MDGQVYQMAGVFSDDFLKKRCQRKIEMSPSSPK